MRIVSILSALLVVATLYLVVLEREHLIAFAQGDRAALGRTAAADIVRGAFGAEPQPEAAPAAAAQAVPEAASAPAAAAPDADTDADAAAQPRPVAVVAQRSQVQPIDRAVVLRGRTEAAREVEVRAETSGRVVSEPLPRGSAVAAGDVLCEIEPGTRPARLTEARARLAEAELNARAAERLSEGGFASDLRAIGAEATLQSAAAAVQAAEEEIARLTLRAPFAGILESEAAERGSLMQPGALCAIVLQLDPIRLVGFVPETRVDQIEPGAMAGARLASGRTVTGTVSFVSRAADPATRTFRVEITVANPDGLIRDGQTAEIGIAATGTDAHLVPGSALTLDDAGRLGLRTVDSDSRARFVPVQVVRDTPQGIWLTGLPETADIIVVGQEFVTEGVPVAVTFRDPPEAPDAARSLLDALAGAPATEPGQ
jgi:multidrug efflux system membrane fusion protein